jgi:hypothetical protein
MWRRWWRRWRRCRHLRTWVHLAQELRVRLRHPRLVGCSWWADAVRASVQSKVAYKDLASIALIPSRRSTSCPRTTTFAFVLTHVFTDSVTSVLVSHVEALVAKVKALQPPSQRGTSCPKTTSCAFVLTHIFTKNYGFAFVTLDPWDVCWPDVPSVHFKGRSVQHKETQDSRKGSHLAQEPRVRTRHPRLS